MNPAFTFLFVYAMHPAEKNRQEVAHMSHADAYRIRANTVPLLIRTPS